MFRILIFLIPILALPTAHGEKTGGEGGGELTAEALDLDVREAIESLQEDVDSLNKMIEEQRKSIELMEEQNERIKKQSEKKKTKKKKKLRKRKPLGNRKVAAVVIDDDVIEENKLNDLKAQLSKNSRVIKDYSNYLASIKKEIAKADAKIKQLQVREAAERYSKVKMEDAYEEDSNSTVVEETNALPDMPTVYIGRVQASEWDKLEQKENVTLLQECIRWCAGIRSNEGRQWNAIEYRNDQMCFCNRNGSGWAASEELVAYQFL